MPNLISESERAFLNGRMITANSMIAFEAIHYIKRKKVGKDYWVALKLDMTRLMIGLIGLSSNE